VPYDPTIYEGAADHYRPGRPPYSAELETLLAEELGLDGSGRLLDGGCGPGILTVRLAHLFEEAVGLDPDPAMLAEGGRVAHERGITNITWVQARAEELPGAAPGPYRLVTFGQSLHWTDEARVAEAVYDLIEALVQKYLGPTKRAGQGPAPIRTHRFEDVLVRTRFGAPRSVFAPGVSDVTRNTEGVLSGYFSFSWSAPHLFGDRVDKFADDVRELLAARSPDGVFWDWPGDTEVILARK
jgi:SAM-dependent methyltransferase